MMTAEYLNECVVAVVYLELDSIFEIWLNAQAEALALKE